jgi:hypothetical protein
MQRFVPWNLRIYEGCTVDQVVNSWILSAAVKVPAQIRFCGICGRQSGTGAGVPRVLRFPLPIIPSNAPLSSPSIIRVWYNRSNRGRHSNWIHSHPQPKKNWTTNIQLVSMEQRLTVTDFIEANSANTRKLLRNNTEHPLIPAISRIMFNILPHLIASRTEKYRWTLVFNSHVTLTNCPWDWQRRKPIWSSWYLLNDSSEHENKVLISICRCEVKAAKRPGDRRQSHIALLDIPFGSQQEMTLGEMKDWGIRQVL